MFVRDLNMLYLKEQALWQNDFDGGGFEWINCDDARRSVISFFRVSEKTAKVPRTGAKPAKKDEAEPKVTREYVIFICNFTPIPDEGYRVGVPVPGKYSEILNSDDQKYGGSGMVNGKAITAQEFLCDHRRYNVPLKLPPLAVVILKTKVNG